jgi:hypothetical protein
MLKYISIYFINIILFSSCNLNVEKSNLSELNLLQYISRPALNITYANKSFVFKVGEKIEPIKPNITSFVTKCTSIPSLPQGITLSSIDCSISGVPASPQILSNYDIVSQNNRDTHTEIISITIQENNVPPSNFSYSGSPFTFYTNTPISTITPSISGVVTSCSGSLPAGLVLNSTTCTISGTPINLSSLTTYTITASNAYGNANANIDISVVQPPSISYSGSPFYLSINQIWALTATVVGTINSCTIEPTIPGVSFVSPSCNLSGTPNTAQPLTTHTITVNTTNGNASTTINVAVSIDMIATKLTTSLSNYNAATINDLVKVTQLEYSNVIAQIGTTTTGYLGSLSDFWATNIGGSYTYAYNSGFSDVNTNTVLPPSSYIFAFSFVPALNPPGAFTCQVKFVNGSTLTNVSNVYSGSTSVVSERQYFVLKMPNVQISPSGTNYLAFYSSSGIGTVTIVQHPYDYISGNITGSASFSTNIASDTQYPTMQARVTTTKQW